MRFASSEARGWSHEGGIGQDEWSFGALDQDGPFHAGAGAVRPAAESPSVLTSNSDLDPPPNIFATRQQSCQMRQPRAVLGRTTMRYLSQSHVLQGWHAEFLKNIFEQTSSRNPHRDEIEQSSGLRFGTESGSASS